MDIIKTTIYCILINCCVASSGSTNNYIEKVIYPTLEDGMDTHTPRIGHQFGRSDSFTIKNDDNFTTSIYIPFNTRCEFIFSSNVLPNLEIRTNDKKDVPINILSEKNEYIAEFTTDDQNYIYSITASTDSDDINISKIRVKLYLPDSNKNSVTDITESLMGSDKKKTEIIPRPSTAKTAFFYGDYFNPRMASATDAIQIYFWSKNVNPYIYTTWHDKGYATQAMLHSRYGGDRPDRDKDVQTNKNGWPITVRYAEADGKFVDLSIGPLDPNYEADLKTKHGLNVQVNYDYYRVPTEQRSTLAEEYIAKPLEEGVSAFGFDEPDFWSSAGYSQAFKNEWEKYYSIPWEAPHLNADNRYKAEILKSYMEKRHIGTIIAKMKEMNPSGRTMLAMHSQINSQTGFTAAYHDLVQIPELQDIIAEVWMGTSQAPTPMNGKREARIFDLGYMEYSSFNHLIRGTGKQLWFMMDPKEDMPGRDESEYHTSFIPNLLASLMFPEIENYIPLIWPNRIYGEVSKEYESIINTITGSLCDFWQYKDGKLQSGSKGIATFTSDTMSYHVTEPYPADLDGLYGMSLPLINKGMPVEVLSLDRVAESGYLRKFKVLALTYEFIKPENEDINKALARWCKEGGTLLFFNKKDPYCYIKDSWWQKKGYSSPADHLFELMDIDIRNIQPLVNTDKNISFRMADNPSKTYTTTPIYTVSPCETPDGGIEIAYLEDTEKSVVWQKQFGNGHVIYAGIASAFLASSTDGSRLMCDLSKKSMELAGEKFIERPYFAMKRGPYAAIRTIGKPYQMNGMYIDLLSPDMAIKEDPIIPENSYAFMKAFEMKNLNMPQLMGASGRIRAKYESTETTSVFVQAPSYTNGISRFWMGDKTVEKVSAFTERGERLPVDYVIEGETILVKYANDSNGIIARVDWK